MLPPSLFRFYCINSLQNSNPLYIKDLLKRLSLDTFTNGNAFIHEMIPLLVCLVCLGKEKRKRFVYMT